MCSDLGPPSVLGTYLTNGDWQLEKKEKEKEKKKRKKRSGKEGKRIGITVQYPTGT